MKTAKKHSSLPSYTFNISFSFTGPCLKIDDTVLKWEQGCCHGDRVAKTTYILIEGYVDQMATGYINLQNCGTAAIKYHWKVSKASVCYEQCYTQKNLSKCAVLLCKFEIDVTGISTGPFLYTDLYACVTNWFLSCNLKLIRFIIINIFC